jgi:hydroxylamine reductase (hybrid-cluster protein)
MPQRKAHDTAKALGLDEKTIAEQAGRTADQVAQDLGISLNEAEEIVAAQAKPKARKKAVAK